MIFSEFFELLARGIEALQIFDGGHRRTLAPDGNDSVCSRKNLLLQGTIAEKRNDHTEDPNGGEHTRGRQEHALQNIGTRAAPAGSERGAVLQNDVAENMAEKEPLRGFLGFAGKDVLRGGLPALRLGFRKIIGTHDGCCICGK